MTVLYRDTGTGLVKYEFEYSKAAGFGKLLAVQDGLGNKVTYFDIMTRDDMIVAQVLLQRDYTHRVQLIENSFGQKFSTKINSLGKLESIQTGQRQEVRFGYSKNDFLLTSVSSTSGSLYYYE